MPKTLFKISIPLAVIYSSAFAQIGDADSLTTMPPTDFSPSLTGIIFKLLFSMVLIVGLIYLSTLLIKKVNARAGGGGIIGDTIKIIGRTFLSPKQALYLVKIGGKYTILGATENSINMIGELSDQEAEQFENMEKTPSGSARSKFAEVFKGIIRQ